MLWSVMRTLSNPRNLILSRDDKRYQIISILRFICFDASQRNMRSLNKETVRGTPFIRIDFVFDIETLIASSRRCKDKELQ